MIHLHTHTSGSQLDGACDITKLVKRAKELNMTALGITDHGNMIKVVEFQKACIKEGIKPIIGCEFYISSCTEDKSTYHLICLAKNEEGLKNLYKLNAYAYTENFYFKPRITWDKLYEHKNGLIVTTACIGSSYAQSFLKHDIEDVRAQLVEDREMFGSDFYIELQPNAIPEQADYNAIMVQLAHELDIPLTVACDVHYINKDDFDSHDTMLCMQVQKKKNDANRFKFSCNDFYLKSQREVKQELYAMGIPVDDIAEAIDNTHVIADKCNVLITFNNDYMPHMPGVADESHELALLCNAGFQKRLAEGAFNGLDINEVVKRVRYELSVIKEKGYCGYFLIVADYIRFAVEHDILTGSRGSACGSEVAYIIGITEIEPMKNGLLFERFLNPERNSPPDRICRAA